MIQSIISDSYESNTYFIQDEISVVIDPGTNPERVLNHKREYNTSTDSLINTHCHFDHIGANQKLVDAGFKAYSHKICAEVIEGGDTEYQLAHMFGQDPVKHFVDEKLSDKDIIDLGKISLEVIHTPGHTKGSICLYESESKGLFCGDLLFVGSIGRSDFLGGDMMELGESLEKLIELHEQRGVATLYPGHGPIGTGADIKKSYQLFF